MPETIGARRRSSCSTRARCSWARPTSTSSPPDWSAPARRSTARAATRSTPSSSPAARARARRSAVATGEVAFALGTDTAGSGRVPAALLRHRRVEADPRVLSNRGRRPRDARRSTACRCSPRRSRDGGARCSVRLGGDAFSPRRARAHASRGARRPRLVRRRRRTRAASTRALDHARAARLRASSRIDVGAVPRRRRRCCTAARCVAERYAAFGAFAAAHPDGDGPGRAPSIVRRAGEYRGTDVFRALETARRPTRGDARRRWCVGRRAPRSRPSPASRRVAESLADPFGPSQRARSPHHVRQPARPRRSRGAVRRSHVGRAVRRVVRRHPAATTPSSSRSRRGSPASRSRRTPT